MRISIIGPATISKVEKYSGFKDLDKLIDDVGKLLAEKNVEIVITPDKGIACEIARAYKKYGGKKVLGFIPDKDTRFGIAHMQNLDLVDEKIETHDWWDVAGEIVGMGDICICIGYTSGVFAELGLFKYLIKFHDYKTKVIIFKKTVSGRLPIELEDEIKPIYINSIKELEKFLR